MNVFLIGFPQSGKDIIGKSLELPNFKYVNLTASLDQISFPNDDAKHDYILKLMKDCPDGFINADNLTNNCIVDGIISPRDFVHLFNYNSDVVVFINRTDNHPDTKEYQNIAAAVIKDYCFWLSSADLLQKNRWLEFNYKMLEDDPEYFKQMGFKNTVFSLKGINSVCKKLREQINNL